MARIRKNKTDENTGQLSLLTTEELDSLLDEKPGELFNLPIRPDDIGGELLAVLSKGLYTNPLDCIREYIQNAVDARAVNVTIKITGNSVIIYDDGTGMGFHELLQSRQFGLSGKSIAENVGFRGIGIYSGFDLCQRLQITTTKRDENNQHVLIFDFAAMRERLNQDKKATEPAQKVSLFDLLSEHTRIGREPLSPGASSDSHFTVVELQDIEDTHIRQLSDRNKMRSYLLQNLPIDFADDFAYKKLINDKLYTHVPGYSAIKITLQSDGIPDEVVTKDIPANLQIPTCKYITTSSGQQVAYYWACLNSERSRLHKDQDKTQVDERISYEGFVFKVKGFTIGDRQRLREYFGKAQLYPWYTGEIYVIDTNVVPNAERDDFETNNAKRALMIAVKEVLGELESEAETFQSQGVATKRLDDYLKEVGQIKNQVSLNSHEGDFDTYSRLSTIMTELKRQVRYVPADRKVEAKGLVEDVERLQKQIRKAVDAPAPEATRRKRAARNEKVADRPPVPVILPPPSTPPKTLDMVLRDVGWNIDGDLARLVGVPQGCLEDVLTLNSPTYRSLISDLEARLMSSSEE